MSKRWIIGATVIGATVVGAALAARCFASSCGRFDVEQKIERMPDKAPRKWMFTNIGTIRENTDQILHLLERRDLFVPDEPERTAA
jgi:hypothetical protein